MTDRQFEKWAKTVEAVGCLHKRHPEFLFGAVFKDKEGTLLLGKGVEVPSGLEVRMWNGEVTIAS